MREYVRRGHQVLVQRGAGEGSGFTDAEYAAVGAELADTAEEVFARAGMILKVKEPVPAEFDLLRPGQLLFTYLHLAADEPLTRALMRNGVQAVAYETVQLDSGVLPLLTPMSEVAGRMSVQVGAHHLEKAHGGNGTLLGGIPGVPGANVVIIGGGVVGANAAQIALGMGANVTIVDKSLDRLRQLDTMLHGRINTLASNTDNVAAAVARADLVNWGGAAPGSQGAEDRHGGDGRLDAARFGGGGRGHRPGRVHRHRAPDDPQRADVCRARRRSLLRDEHAWCGAADQHDRAGERDAAVWFAAGGPRACGSGRRDSGAGSGCQRIERANHASGRG